MTIENKNQFQSSIVSNSTIKSKTFFIFTGLLILFSIITIILTAIILGIIVKNLNSINTTNSSSSSYNNNNNNNNNGSISFVNEIKSDDLMKHLNELQKIADKSNGTRAIGTQGFNDTIDYITNQLKQNTNFVIQHEYFNLRNSILKGIPKFQSEINNIIDDYIYLTDFTHIIYSPSANFDSFIQLVVIPNLGCQDIDWINVSNTNSIALVKRGDCGFAEKAQFAEKYRVKGFLIYNDGIAPDRFQAYQNVRGTMNGTIPGYFLSYSLGMKFINAASNINTNISIIMNSDVYDAQGIANICADTPTGDKTKTIIVGSHSDGVLDGSGINDNGSGTIGNLVLALTLARLLKESSSNYIPYEYRVRFCWWGAEELGLIGSIYHVEQASLSHATIESGRLQDYLSYFNYDMIGFSNYNFGILDSIDGIYVPSGTPEHAIIGTDKIANLFQQWFNQQKLPWTQSGVGGGSDFVPFLTAGIAVGGVNTGANGIKSATERDEITVALGAGNGGLANVAYDSCYHQQCDRIQNINPFAYEISVKAAAYAIEYMGRLNDLEKWIYPKGRSNNIHLLNINKQYYTCNDSMCM
ncbi:unnamed protein product [Adineta steineri]|uniref:Peptide hydrolase n=1 Tax=Adineta steineri TaxID=433720 RepID=A0A813SIU5_9BILA|nr:unnamed protein product [Adineta steineri]